MNDNVLQNDIEIAEAVDEHLQEQSVQIEDIQGSLEAIAQAVVGEGEEPQQLTDHQQEMVDKFKDLAKDHKGEVYAVADAAALEGFLETTASLTKKAVAAFTKEVPAYFKITAKGLTHYVGMAQRLKVRLQELRPLLAKREFPFIDVFDYGAYSRFFQVNGESIGSFSEFQEAMNVQNTATRHVMQASSSYAIVIMEKLLEGLEELQSASKPDVDKLVALREAIDLKWQLTWKDAELARKQGQTPQVALNEYPERKFTSLAPLLDNRYLVAHEPRNKGGVDPTKITQAIRHYGAALVFDKRADKPTQHSMNVPNISDLLALVDETIHVLGDMRSFEELAEKNDDFAKDFKKAADVLNKLVESEEEPEFYGFISEYFKIATAISQSIQQPYVSMAWMYIRCAMVVTSLAELAAVEESGKRVVFARFVAKQGTEFANPAMESFNLTHKALQAAKRVRVS